MTKNIEQTFVYSKKWIDALTLWIWNTEYLHTDSSKNILEFQENLQEMLLRIFFYSCITCKRIRAITCNYISLKKLYLINTRVYMLFTHIRKKVLQNLFQKSLSHQISCKTIGFTHILFLCVQYTVLMSYVVHYVDRQLALTRWALWTGEVSYSWVLRFGICWAARSLDQGA